VPSECVQLAGNFRLACYAETIVKINGTAPLRVTDSLAKSGGCYQDAVEQQKWVVQPTFVSKQLRDDEGHAKH
jgi:hypothetical protein